MAITRIIKPSITDDAVDNTKLDLASNYAFTGTVSGASSLVKVADILSSTSSNTHDAVGCFSSTYDSYFFDLKAKPQNASYQIGMQFLNNTTAIETGYYGGVYGYGDNNAVYNYRMSSHPRAIILDDHSNSRRGIVQGYITAPLSTEANFKRINWCGGSFNNVNVFYALSGSCWNTTTTSCDGIRFISNGSPINYISCQIYGVVGTRS